MTDLDTSPKAVERLHERLGGVEVPEHMHGDNLAILLCSFFENDEGELNDNGWTDSAISGQDAVLAAIRAHYDPTFCALFAKLEAERHNCVTMLSDANYDYNRKTNALIERHAQQITDLKARVEAAEAKLREAVEVMKAADGHLQKLGADGLASGICTFIASLEGDKP